MRRRRAGPARGPPPPPRLALSVAPARRAEAARRLSHGPLQVASGHHDVTRLVGLVVLLRLVKALRDLFGRSRSGENSESMKAPPLGVASLTGPRVAMAAAPNFELVELLFTILVALPGKDVPFSA